MNATTENLRILQAERAVLLDRLKTVNARIALYSGIVDGLRRKFKAGGVNLRKRN